MRQPPRACARSAPHDAEALQKEPQRFPPSRRAGLHLAGPAAPGRAPQRDPPPPPPPLDGARPCALRRGHGNACAATDGAGLLRASGQANAANAPCPRQTRAVQRLARPRPAGGPLVGYPRYVCRVGAQSRGTRAQEGPPRTRARSASFLCAHLHAGELRHLAVFWSNSYSGWAATPPREALRCRVGVDRKSWPSSASRTASSGSAARARGLAAGPPPPSSPLLPLLPPPPPSSSSRAARASSIAGPKGAAPPELRGSVAHKRAQKLMGCNSQQPTGQQALWRRWATRLCPPPGATYLPRWAARSRLGRHGPRRALPRPSQPRLRACPCAPVAAQAFR